MKITLKQLQTMLYCSYKAWLISKEPESELPMNFPEGKQTTNNRLALLAYSIIRQENSNTLNIKSSKKVEKFLTETKRIISSEEPPAFYKNKHCPECQFKESCYKKLKEKDCIRECFLTQFISSEVENVPKL